MRKIEKIDIGFDERSKERNYWLNQLAGQWEKTGFPYDFPKSRDHESRVDFHTFAITGELFSSTLKICSGSDAKLHILLVAAAVLLLNKYTGNRDILLGTPIYKQEVEGEFINTVLVLRNRLESPMTFKELIMQVHKTVFDAAENQNYPMESLLYDLNLSFTGQDFPLFDAALLLENVHDKRYIRHVNPAVMFKSYNNDSMG